jgi:hypothetical protein
MTEMTGISAPPSTGAPLAPASLLSARPLSHPAPLRAGSGGIPRVGSRMRPWRTQLLERRERVVMRCAASIARPGVCARRASR